MDRMYAFVMSQERKTVQLKAILGFLRAFK